MGAQGCVPPACICTHHFRFRRQLLWPFSQKSFLLFREQPSEPFRKESIESAVHEPSSDRYWWSAGQEKVCLIGLLHCKHDRYRFRGFFSQFTTKFVLFFCFLLFSCEQTKKGGEKPNMCTIIREFCKFFLCCLFSFIRA